MRIGTKISINCYYTTRFALLFWAIHPSTLEVNLDNIFHFFWTL